MAELDELSLKISVDDNDSAKKISAVASAINRLQKSLTGLKNVSEQLNSLNDMFKNLGNSLPSKEINKKQKNIFKLDMLDTDGKGSSTKGFGKGISPLLKSDKELARAKDSAKKVSDKVKNLATNYKDFSKNSKDAEKNTSKLGKSFRTLLKSIGRIAFYRAIRNALKEIVQSFKEGIDNVRTIDKDLNKSLNSLSTSWTTIKNSLAMVISPLIESFAPILTKISDTIAVYVNRLSEARAALKGESEYTRILTSDTEEYKKQLEKTAKAQGSLLSFDTFTTHSRKDSYTGVIKSPVTMELDEAQDTVKSFEVKINSITTALGTLLGVILAIKAVQFVSHIMSIADSFSKATTEVTKFSGIVGTKTGNSSLFGVLSGIAGIISGIILSIVAIKNIMNWDETTNGTKKFLDVLTLVLGVVAAIAGLVSIMKAKTLTGAIAGGIAIMATIGGIIASSKSNAQSISAYATGGQFQTADLFYANENGNTELVASSNNGGGSVMNLDQWSSISYSSFYRALADYNAAQNSSGNGLDINALCRTIAGNSSFVNEMNRRNSNLNLI